MKAIRIERIQLDELAEDDDDDEGEGDDDELFRDMRFAPSVASVLKIKPKKKKKAASFHSRVSANATESSSKGRMPSLGSDEEWSERLAILHERAVERRV